MIFIIYNMENYNLVELNEEIINSANKTIYELTKIHQPIYDDKKYDIYVTFEPSEEPTEVPYFIYTHSPTIYPSVNYTVKNIPKRKEITDKELTYIIVCIFMFFFLLFVCLIYKIQKYKIKKYRKNNNDIENPNFGVLIEDILD